MSLLEGKGRAWIVGLVFAALLLVRCAGAPPEARAGQWTAVTDIGTFTFTVDSSGTVVTLAHVLITCQDNTVRMPGVEVVVHGYDQGQDFAGGGPRSEIEDGKVSLSLYAADLPIAAWEGQFSRNGARLSGTWEVYGGNCVSAFEAEGPASVAVPTEAMPVVVITATPAPSPTAVPAETTESLPVVSPEFGVGAHVVVSGTGGAGLGLFRDPDVFSARVDAGSDGEVFVVLDGPRQAGGNTWWLLGDPENEDRQGWAVAQFLQPLENP